MLTPYKTYSSIECKLKTTAALASDCPFLEMLPASPPREESRPGKGMCSASWMNATGWKISKNDIPLEQRTDHGSNSHFPLFKWNCHQLSPFEGKAWKSSTSLFWVLLTLNNAINPAFPWKRTRGDNIQSHHQSSGLYQARAWHSPWKLIYGKIQSSRSLRGCPLGNFCVIALRREKFTLCCNKLTFSPWCYVPDWMQQKINPSCPASIRWRLCWSKEVGKMMLYRYDTWQSSSLEDESRDTLFSLWETKVYEPGKETSGSLSFQNHILSRGLRRCSTRIPALSIRAWQSEINLPIEDTKQSPWARESGRALRLPEVPEASSRLVNYGRTRLEDDQDWSGCWKLW